MKFFPNTKNLIAVLKEIERVSDLLEKAEDRLSELEVKTVAAEAEVEGLKAQMESLERQRETAQVAAIKTEDGVFFTIEMFADKHAIDKLAINAIHDDLLRDCEGLSKQKNLTIMENKQGDLSFLPEVLETIFKGRSLI